MITDPEMGMWGFLEILNNQMYLFSFFINNLQGNA